MNHTIFFYLLNSPFDLAHLLFTMADSEDTKMQKHNLWPLTVRTGDKIISNPVILISSTCRIHSDKSSVGSSLVAQWIKDPALSLQQLRLLLWLRFSPWPENFYILQVQPKGQNNNMWEWPAVSQHRDNLESHAIRNTHPYSYGIPAKNV